MWKAETADNRYELGSDTFVVQNGKIVTQTFAGKISPKLGRLDIDTEGHVPGVDEAQFQRYADEAGATCPVARALTGIPEIVLTARLTGGV